jgi:hypothetical protein
MERPHPTPAIRASRTAKKASDKTPAATAARSPASVVQHAEHRKDQRDHREDDGHERPHLVLRRLSEHAGKEPPLRRDPRDEVGVDVRETSNTDAVPPGSRRRPPGPFRSSSSSTRIVRYTTWRRSRRPRSVPGGSDRDDSSRPDRSSVATAQGRVALYGEALVATSSGSAFVRSAFARILALGLEPLAGLGVRGSVPCPTPRARTARAPGSCRRGSEPRSPA